jgi:NAD(P)-dependent dehydrogenase (short-subunit alcohol dehydrogenase family)
MLLKNKNAVIYGGGTSMAGAIARTMAREGARVFLAGRNLPSLQKVRDEIIQEGGRAEVAAVDALQEGAVRQHLRQVVDSAGTVDISFNLVGITAVQNIPLIEMTLPEFVQTITEIMTTQFLTTTAAGQIMVRQGSGVILSLTATPGGIGYPLTGGFGPACAAMEGYSKNLAAELGPHGVRVVNIRSAGSPDSRPFAQAMLSMGDMIKPILKRMEEDTMLKKLPLMEDIANTALFLASPLAAKITGVTIDVTVGTVTQIKRPPTDIIPRQRAGIVLDAFDEQDD